MGNHERLEFFDVQTPSPHLYSYIGWIYVAIRQVVWYDINSPLAFRSIVAHSVLDGRCVGGKTHARTQ